jgi:hypothetical protein
MEKEDPGKKNKRPRSQNNNHMNPLKCANMQCSRDRASPACSDGGLYMYDRQMCRKGAAKRGITRQKPTTHQIDRYVSMTGQKRWSRGKRRKKIRRQKVKVGVVGASTIPLHGIPMARSRYND